MINIDKEFMSDFGERLKDLRKKKGKTQEDIVFDFKDNNLSINEKTLRRYEKGEYLPEIDNLIALSQYFDVSLDYLIYGKYTSDDNSFTWYDSFKRLGRLIFSSVLIPWKDENPDSQFYGKYFFTSYDEEIDAFMSKLFGFAEEWQLSFEKTGKPVELDISKFDEILKPTQDYKDDLRPSIERMFKVFNEYKQNPEEYISSVIDIIEKHK